MRKQKVKTMKLFFTFAKTIFIFLRNIRAKFTTFMWSLRLKKMGNRVTIYPGSSLADAKDISIGHHVFINSGAHLYTAGSSITIGNYVLIGPRCSMIAAN